MNSPTQATGKFHLHQHPLIYIAVFLVLALGALMIAVFSAGDDSSDSSAGQPTEVTAERSQYCSGEQPAPFDVSVILGLSVEDAQDWADDNGYLVRPVIIDGKPQAMTMDLRENRANVQVDDGVITYYCSMG